MTNQVKTVADIVTELLVEARAKCNEALKAGDFDRAEYFYTKVCLLETELRHAIK
jgi:hypothetical protein